MFFSSYYSRSLLGSAAQKYAYGLKHIWYFQWYISIKNQRTSPIKVSSIDLMRAECHDRLSIANGCSRDVVLSHVSAIQKHVFVWLKINPPKKRRELSILIDTNSPQRYWNSFFKNERLGILSQKMLFPPCVVVDFFFDEEERRYAITRRRQRKEHKKERNSPAQVKTHRTRTPFVRSFPALFIHSSAMREERYKNARFVSLKQKESKRWRKELPPFHPLSSIEVYRW